LLKRNLTKFLKHIKPSMKTSRLNLKSLKKFFLTRPSMSVDLTLRVKKMSLGSLGRWKKFSIELQKLKRLKIS